MRWPLIPSTCSLRAASLAAVALLASGCYVGPVFGLTREGKRTCDADFLSWGGGLTHHVLQGPGDGTFLYDPPGDLVDEVDGFYDLGSGDLWWLTTYTRDSHRVTDHATGYGTLWRDGDLDVSYALEVAWDDDVEQTYQIRTERYGCEETTRTEDEDGGVTFVEGTYAEDAFDYVRTWIFGPLVVEAEGSLASDGAWVEAAEAEDGDLYLTYEEEGGDDGDVTRTFSSFDGVLTIEGEWERSLEGEVEFSYTAKPVGAKKVTWSYVIDGDGDGEGTWTEGDTTCDLVFDDFACKRPGCEADDGRCAPPVAYPRL